MFYAKTKAQSTLEYVILIGFVVAALIAMGVYMKRGVQGKLRESTDQVGEQFDYDNTLSTYTTNTFQRQTENRSRNGAVTTTINPEDNVQIRTGNETVFAWPNRTANLTP